MFGVGPLELVIVLLIVLMVFGAKRLPEMGRQLGSGMREFKEGIVNPVDDVKQEFTSPIAETIGQSDAARASAACRSRDQHRAEGARHRLRLSAPRRRTRT